MDGCDATWTDAVARLYASENARLVKYLAARTRCRAKAEDLAQLGWVKLLAALRDDTRRRPADAGELRAFLYTVARNAFLDECTRKHEAVRTRAVDPADLDAIAGGGADGGLEDAVQRTQSTSLLRRALDRLPPEQRTVLLLWCVGTTAARMAARSGAPVDTVLSRKKYAFARMRRELAVLQGAL